MTTFLSPIEDPQDPTMKSIYDMTRQYFGKVLTPVKVLSARLPPEFHQFFTKINELDQKLTLPLETCLLIRVYVASINVCRFCIDASHAFTIKTSMNQAKFDAIQQYRTSSLFSDAERSALDYVSELTKNKKVNPETFTRMRKYYSEQEICEIVWLVASEHFYNIGNIGLNIESDLLCEINKKNL